MRWQVHGNEPSHQTWSELLWTHFHRKEKSTFILINSLVFGLVSYVQLNLELTDTNQNSLIL